MLNCITLCTLSLKNYFVTLQCFISMFTVLSLLLSTTSFLALVSSARSPTVAGGLPLPPAPLLHSVVSADCGKALIDCFLRSFSYVTGWSSFLSTLSYLHHTLKKCLHVSSPLMTPYLVVQDCYRWLLNIYIYIFVFLWSLGRRCAKSVDTKEHLGEDNLADPWFPGASLRGWLLD